MTEPDNNRRNIVEQIVINVVQEQERQGSSSPTFTNISPEELNDSNRQTSQLFSAIRGSMLNMRENLEQTESHSERARRTQSRIR